MRITPMLAEDYGPLLLMVVIVLVGFGMIGFGAVAVNATVIKVRWWGLVLGLIPTLVGGVLLFGLLTMRGGAPIFFIIPAAVPLVCGLVSLHFWGRGDPERRRIVGFVFRFFLYLMLAIAFVYIVGMLAG